MTSHISLATALVLLVASGQASAQSALSLGCPIVGDTRNANVQALNTLKNRVVVPKPTDFDSTVTMRALLAPGPDANRFSERKAGRVVGYVADVKVGGVESVNCHAKGALDRDTHIELTLDPSSADEATHVIVEVTPRWREQLAKQGRDWNTSKLRRDLKGRWVAIEGWLLYDEEHVANAANTHRGRAKVWRATVWELHPVTAIRLTARPTRP